MRDRQGVNPDGSRNRKELRKGRGNLDQDLFCRINYFNKSEKLHFMSWVCWHVFIILHCRGEGRRIRSSKPIWLDGALSKTKLSKLHRHTAPWPDGNQLQLQGAWSGCGALPWLECSAGCAPDLLGSQSTGLIPQGHWLCHWVLSVCVLSPPQAMQHTHSFSRGRAD